MKAISILISAALITSACSQNDEIFLKETKLPDNEAVEFVNRLGLGWNLGNQMDAVNNGVSGETFWGNPVCTQDTFDELKSKGFSTVRIPVTWMGHIGEAPDYILDSEWLDRLAEIVGYAKNAGLNAIINSHHDDLPESGWLLVHKAAADEAFKAEMMAKFEALWRQVAERFADEGDWLIFEAYNELQDGNWGNGTNHTDGGKQYAVVNELAQTFVNTVRATGGRNAERYLAILGYSANPELSVKNLTLPEDSASNRLVVSFHCYDPAGYAIGQNPSATEWGHTAREDRKVAGHGEENIIATFKMVKEKYIDNNIPVYIGEFGAVNRKDENERLFQQYWLRFFARAARVYGLAPVIWDNGSRAICNEGFGFINHSDGSFISDGSEAAIKALIDAFTGKSTLSGIYKQAPVTD